MPISISIDEETLVALDSAAEIRSISREEMLKKAIAHVAAYDAIYRRKAEAGEKDYREGRFVSQKEASAIANQRKAQILATKSSA